MDEKENTSVIQKIYEAFRRGDIPFILNAVTDDIDWQMFGLKELPHTGPHRGRDQVARFLEKVAAETDIQKFEPKEFIAQGDKVVALGYYSGKSKASGRLLQAEWAMVFTLRDGKVARFREYADTANLPVTSKK
ncbi:MAG TPA: nuclear transport factor 2 family protein [Nitrospiria bacterium]|nr:nuclear transport factor 2 family protein [Nitrospiria bacterium]